MKGYKVFNRNLCGMNNFQYEVGKTYSMDESPIVGKRGFHFAECITDCLETIIHLSHSIRVCEVEALGEIDKKDKRYYKYRISYS